MSDKRASHFAHIPQFGTGFSCGNDVGLFQVVAVSGALKKSRRNERSKGDHGEPQVPWDWGSLYQARRRPIAEKLAERIRAALAGGVSVRKTAAKFEVNPSTVQRIARPFGGAEDASVAA
jgi:DNA invertase Pin-like site-specific DNA recombinase